MSPFEVFGFAWQGRFSFQHGVTELACRLISLHLRRGTPLEEIIDQIQGIAGDAALLEHSWAMAGASPSWASATASPTSSRTHLRRLGRSRDAPKDREAGEEVEAKAA